MRHADFLILVKDYAALEVEANKMIELDKVNPRIYRYLGYSAYENGNADLAIKSLESFIANPENKIIAKDYLYLGTAKFKKGLSADGLSIDANLYNSGLADIKKAVEIGPPAIIEDFNEVGLKMFSKKLYKEAIPIFEFGTTSIENKNRVEDIKYYGLCIYYANKYYDKPDSIELQKSVAAFEQVLIESPSYIDAYIFIARTYSLMDNNEMAIKYFEIYIAKVTEKGPEELAKPTTTKKVLESYNAIAVSYAQLNNSVKAIEYFKKTLELDPNNAYAKESLIKLLK
jgi:tetratricopeptide (TPR) repeat protein